MHDLLIQLVAVLGTLASLLSAAPEFAPEQPATTSAYVLYVVDGDTIGVAIDGEHERVRYLGIDAPEAAAECYADEATSENEELVAKREVQLVADRENRDEYGRLLRYVYAGDVFVNAALIQSGAAETLAIVPNMKHAESFAKYEATARIEERGMWYACNTD